MKGCNHDGETGYIGPNPSPKLSVQPHGHPLSMVGYLDRITMNGKSESWNVKRPAGENGGTKKIWRRVHITGACWMYVPQLSQSHRRTLVR